MASVAKLVGYAISLRSHSFVEVVHRIRIDFSGVAPPGNSPLPPRGDFPENKRPSFVREKLLRG